MACNIIYELSKYQNDLLYILNIKYHNLYNDNVLATKCRNSAMMIILMIIGDNAVSHLQHCDVNNILSRQGYENNTLIFKSLYNNIMFKHIYPSYYYIMMSDGHFNKKTKLIYFPGHVFIFEKYKNTYRIYQSYINEYTLNTFINTSKCKNYVIKDIMKFLLFLNDILNKDSYIWNEYTVYYWKLLTLTDSSKFIGYNVNKSIKLCYKRFGKRNIVSNIKRIIKSSIKQKVGNSDNLLKLYNSI
jgi:hypothetical protein